MTSLLARGLGERAKVVLLKMESFRSYILKMK
jgi:hypothetical protein